MSEADFESAVVQAAHTFGWRAVGHRPLRAKHGWVTGWKYDGTGWPDLTLTHESGLLVVAELKVPPNKIEPAQEEWRDHLEAVAVNTSGVLRYFLWTPADWPEIARVLSFERAIKI
jgi:hypothetical protein